ncbi:Integrase zinc-binding domain [Dillenia turbinata]|uniref:Integrase zinc-binding domain n=1 Tax=Dillenia turbinata TaxID=194707 RepID=A0AAN8YYW4_9MAGN
MRFMKEALSRHVAMFGDHKVNFEQSMGETKEPPQGSHMGARVNQTLSSPDSSQNFTCEQLFLADGTAPEITVQLASIIEDRALSCSPLPLLWNEYVVAMRERFETNPHNNLTEEFKKLQHNGTVVEYADSFDALQTKQRLGKFNSLDASTAKWLGCKIERVEPLMAEVSNGTRLEIKAICRRLKWTIQILLSQQISLWFHWAIMKLVLEVHWLKTMKNIVRDFSKLTMQILHQGRTVVIEGTGEVKSKVTSGKQLVRLLDNSSASYEASPTLQQLIKELIADLSKHLLIRKGKVVAGPDSELRKFILQAYHKSPIGGHSGVRATTKRIEGLFYWKVML